MESALEAEFYKCIKQKNLSASTDPKIISNADYVIVDINLDVNLQEKKGNIDLAISTIEKISNEQNFKNKAFLRIANIYRRNNDYKKSMEFLDKIDLSKTKSPEVYYYKSLYIVKRL